MVNSDHAYEKNDFSIAETEEKDESFFEYKAVRPGGIRLSEKAHGASLRLLQRLFVTATKSQMQLTSQMPQDISAFAVDGISQGADTYGEILPEGVVDMLWTIGARPGDRFYDLGAGAGKVVAQAWMSGLRATGVELSHCRWEASCRAMDALKDIVATRRFIFSGSASKELPKRASGLDFLCGNAFDLDFTDADFIFVSSVMFSDQMVATLAATARWMKPGSLIVSYSAFPGDEFKEIGDFYAPTTWYDSTLWRVQEVVRNPTNESRPPHLRRSHEFDETCRCTFDEEKALAGLPIRQELSREPLDGKSCTSLHNACTVQEVNVLLGEDIRAALQFNTKGLSPLHSIILASPYKSLEIFKIFQALVPEALLLEDVRTRLTPFLTLPKDSRGGLGPLDWSTIEECLQVPEDLMDTVAAVDKWLRRCPAEILRTARLSDHLFGGCSPQDCMHDSIGEHRLESIVGKAIVVSLQFAGRGHDARIEEFARNLLTSTIGPNIAPFDPRRPYRRELSETVCDLQVATATRRTLAMQELYESDTDGYMWLRSFGLGGHGRSALGTETPPCGIRASAEESPIWPIYNFAKNLLHERAGISLIRDHNFLRSRRAEMASRQATGGAATLPRCWHAFLNDFAAVILLDGVSEIRQLVDGVVALDFEQDRIALLHACNGFSYAISDPMSGYRALKLWLLVGIASTTSVVEVHIHLSVFYHEMKVQHLLDECMAATFDHTHLVTMWTKVACIARGRVHNSLEQLAVERISAALVKKKPDAVLSAQILGLLCCAPCDTLHLAWQTYYELVRDRYGDNIVGSESLRKELVSAVLGS